MDSFADLQQASQRTLVDFLRIELELAQTFSDMADSTKDPAHRERLIGNIAKALETVRHFEGRIADRKAAGKLLQEASRLESSLS